MIVNLSDKDLQIKVFLYWREWANSTNDLSRIFSGSILFKPIAIKRQRIGPTRLTTPTVSIHPMEGICIDRRVTRTWGYKTSRIIRLSKSSRPLSRSSRTTLFCPTSKTRIKWRGLRSQLAIQIRITIKITTPPETNPMSRSLWTMGWVVSTPTGRCQ